MIEQTDFIFSQVTWIWSATGILVLILILAIGFAVWPNAFWLIHPREGYQPMLSRAESRVGFKGTVTTEFDPVSRLGRISVEDEDWAAKCELPLDQGQNFAEGETVEVVGHDGILLLVRANRAVSPD